jgi:hypothetical protein
VIGVQSSRYPAVGRKFEAFYRNIIYDVLIEFTNRRSFRIKRRLIRVNNATLNVPGDEKQCRATKSVTYMQFWELHYRCRRDVATRQLT